MEKNIIFFFALCVVNFTAFAQVAINTGGAIPDASSMLDVSSTDKGFLLPRMNMSARNLITSPANGLMIYQTDNTPGLYVNTGTTATPSWKLAGPANKPAYCQISGSLSQQLVLGPYVLLNFNTQGEFNNVTSSTTTDDVTITVTGVYKIYYRVTFNLSGNGQGQTSLFKNGNSFGTATSAFSNSGFLTVTDEGIYTLNAGDVISLRIANLNGGTVFSNGGTLTLLQIY